ncbi:hypothetical protein P152DRAFT_36189 [Eremomyces bilateralis CBS 781.70]|uniref:Uncharacterized protein n=1 Tax=Eremomyces bilateralis CBS 781.70 TaxID=1392243 RepID=A0A6G1G1S8_9PEZI|nr:uncharacterized protein P152DRAFT_36189 [Eremomyces bilateralis CBS 781.70]KAF1811880.1 hypothetical protein P152DRAFT_36189 [Eremomyces bilateralis CBS 781.70]
MVAAFSFRGDQGRTKIKNIQQWEFPITLPAVYKRSKSEGQYRRKTRVRRKYSLCNHGKDCKEAVFSLVFQSCSQSTVLCFSSSFISSAVVDAINAPSSKSSFSTSIQRNVLTMAPRRIIRKSEAREQGAKELRGSECKVDDTFLDASFPWYLACRCEEL